jgi:hypothetical protein
MGFQTREVFKNNSKKLKQNITILNFEIKLFSHCFSTFEVEGGIVDC